MKKSTKAKFLGVMALIVGGVLLSSCTASFCTDLDRANMAYPYDTGVTVYVNKDDVPTIYEDVAWPVYGEEGNDNLYAYIPVDSSGNFTAANATLINGLVTSFEAQGLLTPSYDYFKAIDQLVLDAAVEASGLDKATLVAEDINPWSEPNVLGNENGITANENSILRQHGYLKFYGHDSNGNALLWGNYDEWNEQLALELGASNVPSFDWINSYKTQINNAIATSTSCITNIDGSFGHYGPQENWEVPIEVKDWGYAWSKGFLEGLIVYPVAWLLDTLSVSFEPALTGFGQIWALILVTIIVRIVVLGLTFKSTMDQQKMQALQPQLAKIQAKYPNSDSNQAEKMRLGQEQLALYKRNHVSMWSMILILVVQFPVFIAVWGALQGSAALATGEFLNLSLSARVSTALLDFSEGWYMNANGWWTMAVIFILMVALQIVSVLLPQWLNKRRTNNLTKTGTNPAADRNAKMMKWVNIIMLAFTILISFSLPSAMAVYWAIGSLMSIAQTLFTQLYLSKHFMKKAQKKGFK